MHHRTAAIALALVSTLTAVGIHCVQAQPPRPRLDWVFPPGVKAGGETPLEISGADLEGISKFICSSPLLTVSPAGEGKWKIAAAPEAPSGNYELRAVGAWGISNPIGFTVGPLDEITETEPNDNEPQSLKIPVTVNARVQSATDVDRFRIAGMKGQRLVLSLKADALESPLDATLRVFGPGGRQIAESQDGYDYDPSLELVLPEDGDYRIDLFDAVYGGSPAHRYRLSIHSGATVDAVLPRAVSQEGSTLVRVLGRGLGTNGKPLTEFPPVFAAASESVSDVIRLGPSPQVSESLGAYSFDDQPFARRLSHIRGVPLVESVALAKAAGKLQVEVESNDRAESAQRIELPADFSGTFQIPGDTDFLAFEAEKDSTWVIEVSAHRQHSLAQTQLAVLRLLPDGTTPQSAASVDSLDNPLGPQFEKATRDPRLTFKAPEKGVYLIRLSHLNPREGDARFHYRVVVRPVKPDYRIIVMPTDPAPAGNAVFENGRFVVSVLLDRRDGFDGQVLVAAEDLPVGVTAYPVVFGPGVRKLDMVVEIAEGAAVGEFPLKLRGRSRWSDAKESVDWIPGQKPEADFESGMETVGGTLVRPLVGPANQQRGLSRYTKDHWIAVRKTPVPFRLDPVPLRLFAKRGETVDLPISAVRQNGFVEPIALKLDNLPAQMEAVAGTIPKDQTAAVLKLKIGANVPIGKHTVYITGTGPFGFAKDPAAKEKPNVTWNIPSRPVTLIVSP